ncbi:MAG: NAD(P)-dependent oxidoreductase [Castellaniella sp.]|uniref:precorrin-2 dehydrogenase/sirohydrochlorin ferrochelatase family protein n=2 Tax=Castellaniella sp. TaxID=1955812 RepID=UPI003C746E56
MKALYPLFADLDGHAVLVVGGGAVAERKTRALLNCGAEVRVGAPRLTRALRAWADEGRLAHLDGPFQDDWLASAWLVIAATDDRALNARVRAAADTRRILANVVDDPALSSFQVPAVVDRAPLTIAVSSGGTAPVLARRLRERMEALFDPALGDLARLAHDHRPAIRRAYPDHGARRRFYDWLYEGPVLEQLHADDATAAERMLLARLDEAGDEPAPPRTLRWIAPCPADPGDITLRQLRALNEADVLVHDTQVNEAVLSLARRDADRRPLETDRHEDTRTLEARVLALCAGYRNAVALVV